MGDRNGDYYTLVINIHQEDVRTIYRLIKPFNELSFILELQVGIIVDYFFFKCSNKRK